MQLRDFITNIIYISGLTFLYYLPEFGETGRDPECKMNTAKANALFAWVLLVLDATISLGFMIAFGCKQARKLPVTAMNEFLERAAIGQAIAHTVINPIGFAIFFYSTQVIWTDISSACLHGYDLMDFLIWLFLLLVSLA